MFKFNDSTIEVVLDKIPIAEIIGEEYDVYTICVQSYGNDIDIWLNR